MVTGLQGCGMPWSREVSKCKVPSNTSSFPASTPRVVHSKDTTFLEQGQNPETNCHQKVLKSVVDNNNWMPGQLQPDDHISKRFNISFRFLRQHLDEHEPVFSGKEGDTE